MKILVADDDPQILRALRVTLGARGYDIVTVSNGAAAIDAAIAEHPDLVMLDLGMPKLDGLDVIAALRGWSTVPILVVSGRTDAADKVEALDAGADDYVTKPFSIDELLARLRALTRRLPSQDSSPIVRLGPVSVDLSSRLVERSGTEKPEQIKLTPTEWRILETLLRNPGKLVSRELLLTELWGPNHTGDSSYLRLYLAQLRKKLESEPARPRYLMTEQGMGYRFVPDPE